jgi:beta-D-xylosidase 4
VRDLSLPRAGFQNAKEAPAPLQASSCCKHFVANELDGWNGTDRDHIDSYVPQQDLVDSYLPSFQACVEEGKVTGIMCSCEFEPGSLSLSAPRLR